MIARCGLEYHDDKGDTMGTRIEATRVGIKNNPITFVPPLSHATIRCHLRCYRIAFGLASLLSKNYYISTNILAKPAGMRTVAAPSFDVR